MIGKNLIMKGQRIMNNETKHNETDILYLPDKKKPSKIVQKYLLIKSQKSKPEDQIWENDNFSDHTNHTQSS